MNQCKGILKYLHFISVHLVSTVINRTFLMHRKISSTEIDFISKPLALKLLDISAVRVKGNSPGVQKKKKKNPEPYIYFFLFLSYFAVTVLKNFKV